MTTKRIAADATEHTYHRKVKPRQTCNARLTPGLASLSAEPGSNVASAAEHIYQSPWKDLRHTCVKQLLQHLDSISALPLTLHQFSKEVIDATEHNTVKFKSAGGSVSHHLSTMARAITSMQHTRDERNESWREILNQVMACARRIIIKIPEQHRTLALASLHSFLRNRVDDATLRIMANRALQPTEWWSSLSQLERDTCLRTLELINARIQIDCKQIKDELGSS
jgi:hypothetical protein